MIDEADRLRTQLDIERRDRAEADLTRSLREHGMDADDAARVAAENLERVEFTDAGKVAARLPSGGRMEGSRAVHELARQLRVQHRPKLGEFDAEAAKDRIRRSYGNLL